MIFLDLETTGLLPNRDAIIDFAALKIDETTFTIKDELRFFVNPNELIPHFVEHLTGITQKDVENALPIESRKQEIELFFEGETLIFGHNVQFDIDFLQAHGISCALQVIDTCDLATLAFPEESSFALEVLLQRFGLPHDAHRAYGDVIGAYELCIRTMAKIQTFPQLFFEQCSQYKDSYSQFLSRIPSFQFPSYPSLQPIHRSTLSCEPQNIVEFSSSNERDAAVLFSQNQGDMVFVPSDLVKWYYKHGVKNVVMERRFYGDEQKIRDYLTKQEIHPPLYAKVLRNNLLNIPFTYNDLAIHWNDKMHWNDLIISQEAYQKKYRPGCIVEYSAFSAIDPKTTPHVWVDIQEKVLDKHCKTFFHFSRLFESLDLSFSPQWNEFLLLVKTLFFPKTDYYSHGYENSVVHEYHTKDALFLQIQTLGNTLLSVIDSEYQEGFSRFLQGYSPYHVQELLLMPDGNISFSMTPLSYKAMFTSSRCIYHKALSIGNGQYASTLFGVTPSHNDAIEPLFVRYPSHGFVSPKDPLFLQSVHEYVQKQHPLAPRICCIGGSKKQIESLGLMLQSLGCPIVLAHSLSGKSKTMHNIQSSGSKVVLASWDFIEDSLESLSFDMVIVLKFPFDVPSNPLIKARSKMFSNAFEEYTLIKTIISLYTALSSLHCENIHILDTVIHAEWATLFRRLLQPLRDEHHER